jgi:hypothetical protein
MVPVPAMGWGPGLLTSPSTYAGLADLLLQQSGDVFGEGDPILTGNRDFAKKRMVYLAILLNLDARYAQRVVVEHDDLNRVTDLDQLSGSGR